MCEPRRPPILLAPVPTTKGGPGAVFANGNEYYGIRLPLGPKFGGPLFFAHFSFLGLDLGGLRDRYADYWEQNRNHCLINYEHCVRNPHGFKGYGPDCWGLTASEGDKGYAAYAPDEDRGRSRPPPRWPASLIRRSSLPRRSGIS